MSSEKLEGLAEGLLTASQALVGISVRAVEQGPARVTVAQHRVLVLLDQHGVMSVGRLAEELGIDQSNASRYCTRLARLGLVGREQAQHDGRARDVALTPRGAEQVRAVREARLREIRAVLARMDPGAADEAVTVLRAFQAAAEGLESPVPSR